MGKTPDYTMRAINEYRKSHKVKQLTFSIDEMERLDAVSLTTAEIKKIVMDELHRREEASQ